MKIALLLLLAWIEGSNGDGKLEEIFEQHSTVYVRNNVVTDGTVITAAGPQSAEEFGNQNCIYTAR